MRPFKNKDISYNLAKAMQRKKKSRSRERNKSANKI